MYFGLLPRHRLVWFNAVTPTLSEVMSSSTESESNSDVLYEYTLPVLENEPRPDISQLFMCDIPDNMTADFFKTTFSKYPQVTQAILSRDLPAFDFPPLPTVFFDESNPGVEVVDNKFIFTGASQLPIN